MAGDFLLIHSLKVGIRSVQFARMITVLMLLPLQFFSALTIEVAKKIKRSKEGYSCRIPSSSFSMEK